MKVLLIKLSSLGDVIHTLPAITDLFQQNPSIELDWVVEENFIDIPKLHPHVRRVIPCALRRWRKQKYHALKSLEWLDFLKNLRQEKYDLIIDAQGLIKSTLIARCAKGRIAGFSKNGAREPIASWFYQNRYDIDKNQHAILRLRALFSKIFETHRINNLLCLPSKKDSLEIFKQASNIDYGLTSTEPTIVQPSKRTLLFIHGTTWATKHWPEYFWIQLAEIASRSGFHILLPWGNEEEKMRAQNIAESCEVAEVLPKTSLHDLISIMKTVKAAVCVDTGLSHLAAALSIPTVSLYGPTDFKRTGNLGPHQIHLTSNRDCVPCLQKHCRFKTPYPPCLDDLSPERVWATLTEHLL